MSSSSGCTKVSDVLEILSVQTISDDNYWNIPASSCENVWEHERQKQIFTDAVHYCMVLLRQSDRLTNHKSDVLSLEATLTGHEMFEKIRNVKVQTEVESNNQVLFSTSNGRNHAIAEMDHFSNNAQIEIKEEVIDASTDVDETLPTTPTDISSGREEQNVEKMVCDVVSERDDIDDEKTSGYSSVSRSRRSSQRVTMKNNSMDKINFPPSPLSLTESDDSQTSAIIEQSPLITARSKKYIPLEVKKKVVALAKQHPDWSLKMLKEHGWKKLKDMSQLSHWEDQIEKGGSVVDKFAMISERTYQKFLEAHSNSKTITIEKLQRWAINISRDLYGARFSFNATRGWFCNFRKYYNIKCLENGHLTIAKSRRL